MGRQAVLQCEDGKREFISTGDEADSREEDDYYTRKTPLIRFNSLGLYDAKVILHAGLREFPVTIEKIEIKKMV